MQMWMATAANGIIHRLNGAAERGGAASAVLARAEDILASVSRAGTSRLSKNSDRRTSPKCSVGVLDDLDLSHRCGGSTPFARCSVDRLPDIDVARCDHIHCPRFCPRDLRQLPAGAQ